MIENPTNITQQVLNLAEGIGLAIKDLKSQISNIQGDGEGSVSNQIDSAVGSLSFPENTPAEQQTVATAIEKAVEDAESYTDTAIGTLQFSEDTPEESKTVAEAISQAKSEAESYADSAIATAVSSVYRYKGSVASTSALPAEGNVEGDVYNVIATGDNYAWVAGTDAVGEEGQEGYVPAVAGHWDALGGYASVTWDSISGSQSSVNLSSFNNDLKCDQEPYQVFLDAMNGSDEEEEESPAP